MLSNGGMISRSLLPWKKKRSTLPVTVLFTLSPEMKGAQKCSEKQLKITDGSEN